MRLHKASFPPSVRAGECPLLMAEQLRFEQIFRQGRAVDGHKGLVAAGARGLNGARHKLLARAGLAGNEYRGLGRRDGFHHFHQFAHGLAPAQQKGRRFALRAARFLTFPRRTGMIQGALKRRLKFIQLQRLGKVIAGSQAQRVHRVLHGRPCRHDQNRDRGIPFPYFPERRDTVQTGHAHVGEHGVKGSGLDLLHGGGAVFRLFHGIAPAAQDGTQHGTVRGIVIDDQNQRLRHDCTLFL